MLTADILSYPPYLAFIDEYDDNDDDMIMAMVMMVASTTMV